MTLSSLELEKLSAEERLQLLEQIWKSLDKSPEAFPLSESERTLLDERLDDLEREGPSCIPWEEVLLRIQGNVK